MRYNVNVTDFFLITQGLRGSKVRTESTPFGVRFGMRLNGSFSSTEPAARFFFKIRSLVILFYDDRSIGHLNVFSIVVY